MDFPEELKYSKEHIWVRVENDSAVIGITDYAQEDLGMISGVELPDEGDEIEQDDSIGSIEAQKTVASIYAPFSGTVRSCLLYTSPSPRDGLLSRMPSSA